MNVEQKKGRKSCLRDKLSLERRYLVTWKMEKRSFVALRVKIRHKDGENFNQIRSR